jgi:hypothetical protein
MHLQLTPKQNCALCMAAWDHALANFASIDHAAEQTGIFVVRKNTFTRILFNGFLQKIRLSRKTKMIIR